MGTAKVNVQLPTILVNNAEGDIFFLASHVVVTGLVVSKESCHRVNTPQC